MDKKEKLLPRLLAYAGKRRVLTYLSLVIAGISQLLALAPFLYIWAILRDVYASVSSSGSGVGSSSLPPFLRLCYFAFSNVILLISALSSRADTDRRSWVSESICHVG